MSRVGKESDPAGWEAFVPMYSEPQLLSRLVDALSTAADGLTKLEAYANYWTEETNAFLRRRDKVAAEAILLAYLASRVSHGNPRIAGAVSILADRAEVHIATDRNEALLRRFPQTAATLGVGFVLLSLLGRSQPEIERLIRSALTRGFATLSERSTFRLMDTRWIYGLLDSRLVRPVEELIPLSTLAAVPHPIYTMKEDDYALTHALYYLTDFGRRPPPHDLRPGTNQLLDPFLGGHAVRLDLDLLGEFLIAALVLREPVSPAFRFAWDVFFRAWEQSGGLVGPEYSPTRFAQLDGEEAAAYAFAENYHTLFVGGILCAVALKVPRPDGQAQERQPTIDLTLVPRCLRAAARAGMGISRTMPRYEPTIPPAADLPEWMVSRLLMLQAASEAAPLWLRAAMDCDLSRGDVAAVLYDALLVGAARQYRLVQLAEALAVGADHDMLRSSTFARALEFLLDQQLDDGFVGIHHLLTDEHDSAAAAEAQAAIAALLARIAVALSD